jgi:hypothetical protein
MLEKKTSQSPAKAAEMVKIPWDNLFDELV